MKELKAKIKKDSPYYKMGLNQKGKSIWLDIVSFRTKGINNFKIKAIKQFKNGFAEYEEVWLPVQHIVLKQIENAQLQLDMVSKEEFEELKKSPRYSNRRRFEITTDLEKQYIYALDLTEAQKFVKQLGLQHAKIKQVARLKKSDL